MCNYDKAMLRESKLCVTLIIILTRPYVSVAIDTLLSDLELFIKTLKIQHVIPPGWGLFCSTAVNNILHQVMIPLKRQFGLVFGIIINTAYKYNSLVVFEI